MHEIRYLDYHCSVSEKKILKDLNSFAYDPHETSGYHGGLKFLDKTFKTRDEALKYLDDHYSAYDDMAVYYKEGRKKYYLVKVEWHC